MIGSVGLRVCLVVVILLYVLVQDQGVLRGLLPQGNNYVFYNDNRATTLLKLFGHSYKGLGHIGRLNSPSWCLTAACSPSGYPWCSQSLITIEYIHLTTVLQYIQILSSQHNKNSD